MGGWRWWLKCCGRRRDSADVTISSCRWFVPTFWERKSILIESRPMFKVILCQTTKRDVYENDPWQKRWAKPAKIDGRRDENDYIHCCSASLVMSWNYFYSRQDENPQTERLPLTTYPRPLLDRRRKRKDLLLASLESSPAPDLFFTSSSWDTKHHL